MCVMISVVFLFLFKQKTAYEMRMSDWSSDVCSSDLARIIRSDRTLCRRYGLEHAGLTISMEDEDGKKEIRRGWLRWLGVGTGSLALVLAALWTQRAPKIGRASCRERVCQYV